MIVNNIDQLVNDVLSATEFGSLTKLVNGLITQDLLNNLINTIFGLLGGDSVAPILKTVKGLDFYIKTSADQANEESKKLVIDLTPYGFKTALEDTRINIDKAGMRAFYNLIKDVDTEATWTPDLVAKVSSINWGMTNGDIHMFAKVLAGILTPLNGILEMLLMGEGRFLSVLGLIPIEGGAGYDYAIIPLIEALGFKAEEVMTAAEYKAAVAKDYTQVLGYLLTKIADLVTKILGSGTPIKTLITILPNLAYFLSNDGLLLTVKNLLAPVYPLLETVLGYMDINFAQYLNLETLLSNISFEIKLDKLGKFDVTLPALNLYELAATGSSSTKEVNTSRSNPANSKNAPFANSFDKAMKSDAYAAYAEADDDNDGITNKLDVDAYKSTQTVAVADAGDTLVYLLSWALGIISTEANRKALVDWICEFFELKSGARSTVEWAVNELYNKSIAFNSTDILVSALLAGLGMGVTLEATLMGNVAQIQQIFKDLFGAIGNSSQCTYGAIANALEELTGVWNDTIGSEDDYEDAIKDAEESLNWFQKIIKKIKEFFQRIFSIFK